MIFENKDSMGERGEVWGERERERRGGGDSTHCDDSTRDTTVMSPDTHRERESLVWRAGNAEQHVGQEQS